MLYLSFIYTTMYKLKKYNFIYKSNNDQILSPTIRGAFCIVILLITWSILEYIDTEGCPRTILTLG